jgi:hypothetical protein
MFLLTDLEREAAATAAADSVVVVVFVMVTSVLWKSCGVWCVIFSLGLKSNNKAQNKRGWKRKSTDFYLFYRSTH